MRGFLNQTPSKMAVKDFGPVVNQMLKSSLWRFITNFIMQLTFHIKLFNKSNTYPHQNHCRQIQFYRMPFWKFISK